MSFDFLLNVVDEIQDVHLFVAGYELKGTAAAFAATMNAEVMNASIRCVCAENDYLKVWLNENELLEEK